MGLLDGLRRREDWRERALAAESALAGVEFAHRDEPLDFGRVYSRREVETIAQMTAGAAAAHFLRLSPDTIMPSEQMVEAARVAIDGYDDDYPTAEQLCETAWGIIANAYGGDWDSASVEWQDAAERWRDSWHRLLDRTIGEAALARAPVG